MWLVLQKIEVLKIDVEEAKDLAINHFLEWYTSGVLKDMQQLDSFKGKMNKIKKTLRIHEFNELIFKPLLEQKGYKVIYSNIHTKQGDHNAMSVDLFAIKPDKNAFFVEVKGVQVHTIERVKSNFHDANCDIDKRLIKCADAIDDMQISEISSKNVELFNVSGVSCISSTVDSKHEKFPKENKYLALYVELDVKEAKDAWSKEIKNE